MILPATEGEPETTVAQLDGVSDQRVSTATETELCNFEIEHKQFTNSCVAIKQPNEAPQTMPPEPTTHART